MDGIDLANPIVRIAAVTGEEPADVEAAIITLASAGWTLDNIWKLLDVGINGGEKVVDVCAYALTQPPGPSRNPAKKSQGDRYAQHQRKRNKRNRRKRR